MGIQKIIFAAGLIPYDPVCSLNCALLLFDMVNIVFDKDQRGDAALCVLPPVLCEGVGG